ncbi:MAG: rhodanese-like domain-containing protein [Arcobacteraceae bacterium]|nr:rhodanese-like domain-containing protein [Arcobacteraceae bacterium]
MKKIIFYCCMLVSIAMADFKSISTEKLEASIQNGVTVIDIRREDEFKQFGIIKGSYKLTFFDANGNYNVEQWMNKFTKIVKDKNQPFILVCARANRTKVVGQMLSKQLQYKNVLELEGGITNGWIFKGKPTVK